MKSGGEPVENFDTCDYISAGIAGAYCGDIDARISADKRNGEIAELTASLPSQAKLLFDEAYERFSAYASVSNEMNCFRGTAQAYCSITGTEADLQLYFERARSLILREEPDGGFPRNEDRGPAAMTHEEWKELHSVTPDDWFGWYDVNREEALAARSVFEPHIIALFAELRPDLSAEQVRQHFADL